MVQLPFTYFSKAKDCLADITTFSCNSNISYEFFYQLSMICNNIKTLTITFENVISNGLADLKNNLNHDINEGLWKIIGQK